MSLDPALLARIQFGFTVSFHIIFPTISIGLAMFLAIIEGLWLKTKDPLYLQIYRFWLGIFAMAFGVGVVTGIVLSFEFGLSLRAVRSDGGTGDRPDDRARSSDLVLSGGRLSRDHAVWAASGRAKAAFPRHLHGGARNLAVGILDSLGQ